MLTSAFALGTVSVAIADKALGPLTRNDLDALPSNESLLGLFAGDRPIVSARRGPPDSCVSSPEEDGCGIMLDRRRVFSLRMGPTFDLRRLLLLLDGARRGADVGRRRVGLALRSPFLGTWSMEESSSILEKWFMLLSESGDALRTGEPFSSASWRDPREVAPLALRNPGSSRLDLGRLLVLDRKLEEDEADAASRFGRATKLRLRLSSVLSSSHSLSDPATEWLRPMLSALSVDVIEMMGGISFCPASSRSP